MNRELPLGYVIVCPKCKGRTSIGEDVGPHAIKHRCGKCKVYRWIVNFDDLPVVDSLLYKTKDEI